MRVMTRIPALMPTLLIALSLAPAAHAATVGGSMAGPADGSASCGANCVFLAVQPAPRAVPADGVITSWKVDVAAAAAGFRLGIVVDQGAGVYRLDRLGSGVSPTSTGVHTVADRIPVKAGEYAAIATGAGAGDIGRTVGSGGYLSGSTPVGGTFTSGLDSGTLRYEATVEPDADGDGFGDTTQDACPTDKTRQTACAVPPPDPAPTPARAGGGTTPAAAPTLANVVLSGRKVLFTASAGGTVTIRITRLLDGRRSGKRCVAPAKARRGAKCVRRGAALSVTRTTGGGAGSATIDQGLLRRGRYEVLVTLRDAAGATSKPARLTLNVKR